MPQSLIRSVALLLLLTLALPNAALAQATGAAELRGTLFDAAGRPAEGYQVALKTADGKLVRSKPTPADGSFAMAGLPPETYQLTAFAPNGREIPVIAKAVTLAAGQKERTEIRLTSDKPVAAAAPAGSTAAGATTGGASFSWKPLVIAAVAIGGTFALGEWLIDDDDDDLERAVSPSLPPSR
jgi:hypothetical protein